MTSLSTRTLPSVEDGSPYADTSSATQEQDFIPDVIPILILCIGIIGLVGNGIVACLLGFYVKRSPFTTYILNLAVADFGFLLFLSLYCILRLTNTKSLPDFIFLVLAISMYTAGQFLLTAISIDRCVSILFPIWHRCHRPPHLSAIACAIIWALSFLLIFFYVFYSDLFSFYLFNASAVLCLLLVTVSTLILLFKVFCKSQQPRKRRLLTIVLLILLFFLIFAYPLNAILLSRIFAPMQKYYLIAYGCLCASLNSCVNPVIYYMVGRKKRGQQRQSLKVILQRTFKEEEEEHREEGGTTAQTSL